MRLKTQLVIIGVALFLIDRSLDFLFNVLSADEQVVNWYKGHHVIVLWISGVLVIAGIILAIFNINKGGESKQEHGHTISTPMSAAFANKDEKFLREQLARHQENRRQLLKQKSIYAAGEEPLHLLNQIAAEEKAIKEIEQQLRK